MNETCGSENHIAIVKISAEQSTNNAAGAMGAFYEAMNCQTMPLIWLNTTSCNSCRSIKSATYNGTIASTCAASVDIQNSGQVLSVTIPQEGHVLERMINCSEGSSKCDAIHLVKLFARFGRVIGEKIYNYSATNKGKFFGMSLYCVWSVLTSSPAVHA
ncbi:hypothetical protein EGR_06204 [Echinococcus granulosus]|uniref:Uncharacterized protein n=1 Tax=Echinococcus granulosus TaxID=6210 RepID=W6UCJ9_ECHGR|nr:hypothetical protein EGR_06204 [Echinococcus granulosus]EUB58985.1 hypothetical protein EGR_06204 [Echinococcus granulosus]